MLSRSSKSHEFKGGNGGRRRYRTQEIGGSQRRGATPNQRRIKGPREATERGDLTPLVGVR